MKDTLTEIKKKNNLQGNNSRMDEAENQINDFEHKETNKQKTQQPRRTVRRKKNKKK